MEAGKSASKHIITVDMDGKLKVIDEIFSKVRFQHLLVTEHQKLACVISDRCLLKILSLNANSPAESPR